MKIFIIADDHEERDLFQLVLRHIRLDVAPWANIKQILDNWSHNWANLIVLATEDRATVVEQVSRLRVTTQVPLLIITDPLIEAELCAMLRAGADLVLQRPVSPRIFTTYIQVLLRRSGSVPAFVLPTLEWDEIKLDPATHTVTVNDQEPRRLTHLEFNLLYLLMTNRNQVVPTDVIVERVWGYSGKGDRELVRGLVSRLRHKLEPGAKQSRFIQNIPGVGYRLSLSSG